MSLLQGGRGQRKTTGDESLRIKDLVVTVNVGSGEGCVGPPLGFNPFPSLWLYLLCPLALFFLLYVCPILRCSLGVDSSFG